MNWVCIDGEFVPGEEARISVWDHGFLYGDGIFETMRAYSGKVLGLEEHLARLRQGAELLRLEVREKDTELVRLLNETIKRNDLADAYIRLTYSRGSGPIGLDPALCPKATMVIMAKPPAGDDKVYREGIGLGISPVRRNHPEALTPAVKSVNFLNNILAKIWAKENNYAEALLLSQDGWVSETTVSNIFFVRGGKVFTPALGVGILPGVTRRFVLEVIRTMGLNLEEGFYSTADLAGAEEIFLTNSGSELIPVSSLDGKPVGSGKPGRLTQEIHAAFKKFIDISKKIT